MRDKTSEGKEGTASNDVPGLLQAVGNTLRFLSDAGCRGFDCPPSGIERVRAWGAAGACPAAETLEDIRARLQGCRRCVLSETRTQIVFGEGALNARLVFVGEGPGYEEDRQGAPFVGAAGQLLDRIIAAMHMKREDVYICNVVKCRPPGNRNPSPAEIEACKPFLLRQIEAIGPQFICALGSVAAQAILATQKPISKLRGGFHAFMGVRVMPTYHPAYLLRNPDRKRDVWQDMQLLMREMGV